MVYYILVEEYTTSGEDMGEDFLMNVDCFILTEQNLRKMATRDGLAEDASLEEISAHFKNEGRMLFRQLRPK